MIRRTLYPLFSGFSSSRMRTAILIPALAATFGFSTINLYAESATSFYKRGQTAEARQDYDGAFDGYSRAYRNQPKEVRYRAALERIRVPASSAHILKGRKLAANGDDQAALIEFLHAAEIDPSNEAALQEVAKLRTKMGEFAPKTDALIPQIEDASQDITSISAPLQIKPLSNEPLSLHMTEDAKVVYQAIGKAAGINILFDPDYNSKRVQVDLNNVSLFDALRIIGTLTNTFSRPITANTLFVAQNSRVKRTELDDQAVQTFYLTNAWQQNDMTDIQTALRNVMPNAKVYGVAGQNAIVMRGTPDELLLAQKLVSDLDKARPEVVVDIAIMEVSKNWERTLGISWPTSVGVSLQNSSSTSSSSSSSSTTSSTSTTLSTLANLKASNFAVSVGSATLNMLLTDSNTSILQSPRIRATDAQKASMKIGSRIPVATGSYSSTTTTTTSSLVNTQFQYIDVGVNIEMTPTIHHDNEVTLKMKIEVSSESGTVTISSVTEPIISQRVIDQVIRLKEGEASILGGIQDNQKTMSWSGIPGLSSIPLLRYIFGSKDATTKDDDLVFVVVPHIVRNHNVGAENLRPVDTGSGQTIELRRSDSAAPTASAKPATPAASVATRPVAAAAPPKPPVGVVQAQTAEAASPALIQQLREAANPAPTVALPSAPPALPAAIPASLQPTSTPTGLSFTLPMPPAAQLTSGSTFQIPVLISGGSDVASVPLQFKYDPAVLSLVNVVSGPMLKSDGQAVALVHRDDGPGNITVVASRPPGVAGVSGSGVVCLLSFQAKAAGDTNLTMTRASIINSNQQPLQTAGPSLALTIR